MNFSTMAASALVAMADGEAARPVVQMCRVISRSDSEFSEHEVDAARDMCAAPWLDPGDVGL